LCTNDSTISRLLYNLRACRFLDHDNKMIGHVELYPGMFISTQSVSNLCEVIDAFEFSFEALTREAIENLDLKQDGFGRKVVVGFA
jgi:DNA-binding IclR family transcriptional regulator